MKIIFLLFIFYQNTFSIFTSKKNYEKFAKEDAAVIMEKIRPNGISGEICQNAIRKTLKRVYFNTALKFTLPGSNGSITTLTGNIDAIIDELENKDQFRALKEIESVREKIREVVIEIMREGNNVNKRGHFFRCPSIKKSTSSFINELLGKLQEKIPDFSGTFSGLEYAKPSSSKVFTNSRDAGGSAPLAQVPDQLSVIKKDRDF